MPQENLKPSSQMLIEAGIIPKSVLQHLGKYGLVPADSVESHGSHPISLDTSKPQEVTQFVQELAEALSKDIANIRETELDLSGGFESMVLHFEDEDHLIGSFAVDRLRRVMLPPVPSYKKVRAITFEDSDKEKAVVRIEERFKGNRVSAFVVYVEALEEEPHDRLD